jgi:uncharacterized protein
MTVRFEWDEAKRRRNVRKHGVDFTDCPGVICDSRSVTVLDDRFFYAEERFRTFGWLQDQLIVIAHTEFDGVVRIISARKTLRHEQQSYFNYFREE